MVVVNGRHVALFRLGDEFFAIDNLCLHRGGPLCEGFIDNDVVTCPWHGWSYKSRPERWTRTRGLAFRGMMSASTAT